MQQRGRFPSPTAAQVALRSAWEAFQDGGTIVTGVRPEIAASCGSSAASRLGAALEAAPVDEPQRAALTAPDRPAGSSWPPAPASPTTSPPSSRTPWQRSSCATTSESCSTAGSAGAAPDSSGAAFSAQAARRRDRADPNSTALVTDDRPASAPPRIVIVGAGFGGVAAAIELRRHGFDEITLLEAAPELRWDLVLQTITRARPAMCPAISVFVFLRAATRLVTAVLAPVRDPALPAGRRRRARHHPPDPLLGTRRRMPLRRGGLLLAGDDAGRCELRGRRRPDRRRPTQPALDPVAARARALRRAQLPFGALGSRLRHGGQASGRRRQRRQRRAVRSPIAATVAQLTVFQRTANWMMPRKNHVYPRWLRIAIDRLPGLQWVRRRFVFNYTELITMAIRHPRSVGRVLALRSAAFMRSPLPDLLPNSPTGRGRTTHVRLQSGSCSARITCRRWHDPTSSSSPTPITEVTETGLRTADGGTPQRSTASSGRPVFRRSSSWRRCASTAPAVSSSPTPGAGGAHAHLGMAVPGFAVAVLPLRPEHEHLGGLDHRLSKKLQAAYIRQALERLRAGGHRRVEVSQPTWRRRPTASSRPASPVRLGRRATRGTATRTGESSPTGRATCASTCSAPRSSIPMSMFSGRSPAPS